MNHNTIFRAKRLGIVTLKFCNQVVPVITQTRKARNFRFYKCKLSRINASFLVQVKSNSLEEFEKMTGFRKSYCPFISKSLHIHFNPSQNVSLFLLLNGLVMVKNDEGSNAYKFFK